MEIFAYFVSAFIGIFLGLIGGGGSIMTVPVLVYLFGITPLLSTSYSLFIVGSTSLVGAIQYHYKKLVNIKVALLFGMASVSTVFLIRRFIIPRLPKHILQIGGFELTINNLTMIVFAVLMLISAIAMIKNGREEVQQTDKQQTNTLRLLFYGIGIGITTGLLGAGGGFLLIPTLVLLVELPVKEAIGTSLFIIALNSLIGFTGDLGHFAINWLFLLKITVIAIAGMFIGEYIGQKMNGQRLKKGFGWFVLIMSIYIIIKEI